MSHVEVEQLSVELEVALLHELVADWRDLNGSYFGGTLCTPQICLSDTTGRLGLYDPQLRVIEISRSLVLEQPWGTVLEVLKHEMAHQFVFEVLGKTVETSHGAAFRTVCERLGIDARASGIPSSPSAGAEEADRDARILERVARLLALAQSSNVHEAQLAASTAQKLMLKYNLETAASSQRRSYEFRHLGKPKGRITESERLLATILDQHFFVEVIWVPVYLPFEKRRGQVLEICGTHSNLEMAVYVHGFLTAASEHLWLEHKRETGIRSNRDRRTFLAGVMEGFRETLAAQNRAHHEQGLVWVGDADLQDYYRKRHPRIRHIRTTGQPRTPARGHGQAAGRTLVLHRGVTAGTAEGGPKLLAR